MVHRDNMVELSLTGEGISFNREIPENVALEVMNIVISNGTNESGAERVEEADGTAGLPTSFFERLTSGQDAFVRVLLDDGGWVSSEDLRKRMERDYGHSTGGPQALAGIRAGFTRKYGDDLNLVDRHWMGDQNEYKLISDHREEIETTLS
jgi:hypothetical protein